MKQKVIQTVLLTALMGSLVVFTSSCSKKSVVPPASKGSASSGSMSSGNDINYPPAEYSEGSIEGTLDDGGNLGGADGSNITMDGTMGGDTANREYKLAHGRSSENLQPIYYEFDQYMISGANSDIIVTNGNYIQESGVSVVIEGNCDERGTNEYNIALGEKRAQGAKQYLIDLGVDESRLRTVSYGEERPLFTEQDETSWEYNRRADFIIQ